MATGIIPMRLNARDLEIMILACESKQREYYRVHDVAFDNELIRLTDRKIERMKRLRSKFDSAFDMAASSKDQNARIRLTGTEIDMALEALKAKLREYRANEKSVYDRVLGRLLSEFISNVTELHTKISKLRREKAGIPNAGIPA